MSEKDAVSRLAEAKRLVTQELHKQGTPEYDPRSHERAIEAERKAQDAVDAEQAARQLSARRPRALVHARHADVDARARGPASMYLDVEINRDPGHLG